MIFIVIYTICYMLFCLEACIKAKLMKILAYLPFKGRVEVVVPIVAAKVLALADNRLTALCEVEEPEEAAVAPLPELMGGMTEIKTAPRPKRRELRREKSLSEST